MHPAQHIKDLKKQLSDTKAELVQVHDAYLELTVEHAQLGAELELVRKTLNITAETPWALKDILSKLAEAADILLHQKDYDGHGWEVIQAAMDAARALEPTNDDKAGK